VSLHYRGERLTDGGVVGEDFAVAIGPFVVEGTREELRDLLVDAVTVCAELSPAEDS
jgi:hypothetical protein